MKIEARCGAWLLRLLNATLKWDVQNQPPNGHTCVYAFWHRNLLLLAMQRMFSNAVVMVSSSQDGELIAGPLKYLGYKTVRGSTTRHGSQALKQMIRLAKNHSLAITPDGPKGPVGMIQPGLFQLALLARVPIIPIVAHAEREWVLNSWDRFRVPKPFSRIKVSYGDPISVPSREEFAAAESQLRQAFRELESLLINN